MATQTTRTLPAQFVEDLGKDLAEQVVAQSGVPVVTTGLAGLGSMAQPTQQSFETAEQFKTRQGLFDAQRRAALGFEQRQQALSGLAPQIAGLSQREQDARTRATQILSGNELSPDTVITMNAWFARHESDKSGEGYRPGEPGYPSNGRVAWAAWGGDPGQTWARAKSNSIKKARERTMTEETKTEHRAEPDGLKVGDFVRWNSSGGTARGKIDRIVRDGSIDVPDSSFTITGTPDDPAALITVYREVDGDYEETDVQVGHKFSTLTKIDSLRSVTTVLKRSGETSFSEKDENTYEFSFSSEYPVERSFGTEILSPIHACTLATIFFSLKSHKPFQMIILDLRSESKATTSKVISPISIFSKKF